MPDPGEKIAHTQSGWVFDIQSGWVYYTIPRVDLQVSGNFQSLAGPQILTNYTPSFRRRRAVTSLAGRFAKVGVTLEF